jgi:hypothetical protein
MAGSIASADMMEEIREFEVGSTEGGDGKTIWGSMGGTESCVMSMGEHDVEGTDVGVADAGEIDADAGETDAEVQVCIMTSNQGRESNREVTGFGGVSDFEGRER